MKKFIGGPLPVPLTPAVLSPPLLFVSGQVPTEADGSIPAGIEAQTDLVLRKIKGLVEEAGYTMADIVKTTVFMRDMSQFEAMNSVYRKYFTSNFPARSAVRAEVAIAADVEIEAIAMKPST
jgi:2-iminobutanoate/2-iminopropanoate deaminase